jgi:hypothetical protein
MIRKTPQYMRSMRRNRSIPERCARGAWPVNPNCTEVVTGYASTSWLDGMPSGLSDRQKRKAFLVTPLAELVGWHLAVGYGSCVTSRLVPVEEIAARVAAVAFTALADGDGLVLATR